MLHVALARPDARVKGLSEQVLRQMRIAVAVALASNGGVAVNLFHHPTAPAEIKALVRGDIRQHVRRWARSVQINSASVRYLHERGPLPSLQAATAEGSGASAVAEEAAAPPEEDDAMICKRRGKRTTARVNQSLYMTECNYTHRRAVQYPTLSFRRLTNL